MVKVGHDNQLFLLSFIYTLLFKGWLFVPWTQIKICQHSPFSTPVRSIYTAGLIYITYSYNHAIKLIRGLQCVSIKYTLFIIWLQFIYYWWSFLSPVPTPTGKLALRKLEMSPKIYRVELNAFMNIQVLNNPSVIIVFKKIITNCFQISMGALLLSTGGVDGWGRYSAQIHLSSDQRTRD